MAREMAMPHPSRPINVTIDAGALFIAALSWVCLVWIPAILVLVPFILRRPTVPALAYIVVLIPIAGVAVLLGLLLKWLAKGVVLRKRARILFSMALLILWAMIVVVPARHSSPRSGLKVFSSWVQAAALLCAASVVGLGLTKGARSVDE